MLCVLYADSCLSAACAVLIHCACAYMCSYCIRHRKLLGALPKPAPPRLCCLLWDDRCTYVTCSGRGHDETLATRSWCATATVRLTRRQLRLPVRDTRLASVMSATASFNAGMSYLGHQHRHKWHEAQV